MSANEKKSGNFWSQFKDLLENANRLAGLFAAVIAAITFASGNRIASYAFIIIACASIDWMVWRFLTSVPARRGALLVASQAGETTEMVGKKSIRRRVLATGIILPLTLVALGWVGVNAYQDAQHLQANALIAQGYFAPTATPNEQLMIVTEFEQSGTKKYDATRRIHDRLEEELTKAGITNVRLVVMPKVSNKEEARALGQRHQAVFVIWGWYDDNGITPNFTIVKESQHSLVNAELKEVVVDPIRDFAVYVSQGLPAQMSYLATFTIGQLYYWDGKYDQALGDFDVAVANLEQSRRIEGIPLPDGAASLYFYRGYIRQEIKNQPDQAIDDYNQTIELDPKFTVAYNNRGVAYANKGDLDQANAEYTRAIELDPKYALAYYNRGFNQSKKGNLEQAIADYTKAIELNPADTDSYTGRGDAYADQGKLDQAIADCNEAIKLDPKDARAFNTCGNVYFDNGNLDQAVAEYTKSIELDPTYAWAYSNRGTALNRENKMDQALADFTKAIEVNPMFAAAYNNRGYVYVNKGDFVQALADFNKAIELDPKYANGYDSRCEFYLNQGRLDQAIADCDKAIELDPKSAVTYNNRGRAFQKEGLKADAVADFKTYLQLKPNASDRAQVEQFIRDLQ
jgi:tetratricopeptide (TPR) repeat protein